MVGITIPVSNHLSVAEKQNTLWELFCFFQSLRIDAKFRLLSSPVCYLFCVTGEDFSIKIKDYVKQDSLLHNLAHNELICILFKCAYFIE